MPDAIEIRYNPPDLLQRMAKYPDKLKTEQHTTMRKALFHVQASVPGYPPQRPTTYRRTGTLGRSLTIGGLYNLVEIKPIGHGVQGRIGTRVEYAKYVIGEDTQAWMHRGYWWDMGTVKQRAKDGIVRLFDEMANKLVNWLDGR